MNPLKLIVLAVLLIGIGVHIYSLAVTPYPFPDEPNWSHYAHLLAYFAALLVVWKQCHSSLGTIVYAIAVVFPVYSHVNYLMHEIKQEQFNYANIVACVAVIVFLPWGIALFKKERN